MIVTKQTCLTICYTMTIAVLCCACNTVEKNRRALDSWIGHPISEAIQAMGPATATSPDGQGGQVYSWVYQDGGGFATNAGFGNTLYVANKASARDFFVDANGTIYKWMTR